jgi:hypothetical protein
LPTILFIWHVCISLLCQRIYLLKIKSYIDVYFFLQFLFSDEHAVNIHTIVATYVIFVLMTTSKFLSYSFLPRTVTNKYLRCGCLYSHPIWSMFSFVDLFVVFHLILKFFFSWFKLYLCQITWYYLASHWSMLTFPNPNFPSILQVR